MTGSVTDVTGRAERNAFRVRVPSPSVVEARQVLQAVPGVIKVTPAGGMAGWLRVEPADSSGEITSGDPHLNNRILDALISAEIPILGFEPEGGRLQDVFLHLTAEVIK